MALPSPALPMPPAVYDQGYMTRLLNVLRLYFDFGDPEPELYNMCGIATYSTTPVYLGISSGEVALVDASTGPITVFLPAAGTSRDFRFSVKKTDTGVYPVTVRAAGSTIDGSDSAVMTIPYTSLTFKSDGSNYWIL